MRSQQSISNTSTACRATSSLGQGLRLPHFVTGYVMGVTTTLILLALVSSSATVDENTNSIFLTMMVGANPTLAANNRVLLSFEPPRTVPPTPKDDAAATTAVSSAATTNGALRTPTPPQSEPGASSRSASATAEATTPSLSLVADGEETDDQDGQEGEIVFDILAFKDKPGKKKKNKKKQQQRMNKPANMIRRRDKDTIFSTQPRISAYDKFSNQTGQRNFQAIGEATNTDKVIAILEIPGCQNDSRKCANPSFQRQQCRPFGHFYQTLYQSRLGPLSVAEPDDLSNTKAFQFLEIGFFHGEGLKAYERFLPTAEAHSIEISCSENYPWENEAVEDKEYFDLLRRERRLHCGDANDQKFLNHVWTNHLNRPGAPPLRVVVDDGSHRSRHMVQSVLFWFPRLEPGGLMFVEDIWPSDDSNLFRTQFLPQIITDLHYCGNRKMEDDSPCFPTLMPLLQSVHCEMHICVFERNQEPSRPNLPLEQSAVPRGAFDHSTCSAFRNPFGEKG